MSIEDTKLPWERLPSIISLLVSHEEGKVVKLPLA